MEYQYHYFYKITNKINGRYYYGVHNTNNLDDGYMGSGKILHLAYKKYGVENFIKEILKFFNSTDEAFAYEALVVNENIVKDDRCYNIQQGGKYFNCSGLVCVKDKNDNYFMIRKDDPRYLNKKVVFAWEGKHHTEESKNKTRNTMYVENSKNNRIWVHKNGVVKYLLKKYLSEYIDNGWLLGRVGYKPRKNCQGKKNNLG